MLEQKQALKCISYNYWEEVDHKVGVVKQKNLFAKGILIDIYTLLLSTYSNVFCFKVSLFSIFRTGICGGKRNII